MTMNATRPQADTEQCEVCGRTAAEADDDLMLAEVDYEGLGQMECARCRRAQSRRDALRERGRLEDRAI